MWAGPEAATLPLSTPIHIITACNPYEEPLSDNENILRNESLYAELTQLDVEIKPVVGRSPSGDWHEDSFAIYGFTRKQACKIACKFNQRGIFELTVDELLVIDVNSHAIKRHRPR